MEKYFIQNNTTGYLVKIFEVGFTGISTEIFGKISFEKGSVNNILDTIRGTGLRLQLEANPLLTFDEFSDADEKKYSVQVMKNTQVIYNGFLKPDGITQSFVRDIWYVDLDFVDGLGSLKDLAFVKADGTNFIGKMSVFNVIVNSLARTGLAMTINSFIPVQYLDYSGSNILKDTYVNADRFFKIDAQATGGGTTMTCEEVLNSALNLFSACITQQDGTWWIYRPNDLTNNTTFTNNTLDISFVKNLYKKVGSQIDNFYPHHCSGNQQIQTKGAISAYRINYKYGFKAGMLLNSTLHHDSSLNFEHWTKATSIGSVQLVNDPLDTMGLIMITQWAIFNPRYDILTSESVSVLSGSQIDLEVSMYTERSDYSSYFGFRVVRSDGFWADENGAWQSTPRTPEVIVSGSNNHTWTLKCEPVPNDCSVFVVIRNVQSSANENAYRAEIQSCQLINNFNYDGRVGEFHTVSRLVSPSSIVKENQEVYNGDSIGDIFEGAIYKNDQTTLTTFWTRNGYVEEKYLLRISAEDDLRIQQKPAKQFSGSFFGELPYLSIIEINNISGKFMFIEHNYDTETNITTGKLMQFYTDEVMNLEYALTYDYGNTVKPSIRS